ncbi:MAG TPA: hypothetical protein VEC99_08185 [Clostridia bacterium]|nr:hypothetical protein [Clostridia bacterium]
MKEGYAQELLAKVMGWSDADIIQEHVPLLQLLSEYKYDEYQRFGPGKRFIESLALWLSQFATEDRPTALSLVERRLIFISEQEMSHLVQLAYPDVIVQHRLRMVAEENSIPSYRVGTLVNHPRFEQLRIKSLYLGLSDGAHTNELRRSSNGGISNEQIWQAYELGEAKAEDMLEELSKALGDRRTPSQEDKFSIIWLVDDFSGSGNTYIRYDSIDRRFKGKIKKIYERILDGLVNPCYYEVSLLLYVATRQAIDHIEYWSECFTSEYGYKPLKLHVLWPIENDVALSDGRDGNLLTMLRKPNYYDERASDRHIAVGGTPSAQLGFAGCALPLALSHNTPNNSVYALWGPEEFKFSGLFPRVSRHRET